MPGSAELSVSTIDGYVTGETGHVNHAGQTGSQVTGSCRNRREASIYRTGKYADLAGKERKVTGAVPREDALILQETVRFVKAKTKPETSIGPERTEQPRRHTATQA